MFNTANTSSSNGLRDGGVGRGGASGIYSMHRDAYLGGASPSSQQQLERGGPSSSLRDALGPRLGGATSSQSLVDAYNSKRPANAVADPSTQAMLKQHTTALDLWLGLAVTPNIHGAAADTTRGGRTSGGDPNSNFAAADGDYGVGGGGPETFADRLRSASAEARAASEAAAVTVRQASASLPRYIDGDLSPMGRGASRAVRGPSSGDAALPPPPSWLDRAWGAGEAAAAPASPRSNTNTNANRGGGGFGLMAGGLPHVPDTNNPNSSTAAAASRGGGGAALPRGFGGGGADAAVGGGFPSRHPTSYHPPAAGAASGNSAPAQVLKQRVRAPFHNGGSREEGPQGSNGGNSGNGQRRGVVGFGTESRTAPHIYQQQQAPFTPATRTSNSTATTTTSGGGVGVGGGKGFKALWRAAIDGGSDHPNPQHDNSNYHRGGGGVSGGSVSALSTPAPQHQHRDDEHRYGRADGGAAGRRRDSSSNNGNGLGWFGINGAHGDAAQQQQYPQEGAPSHDHHDGDGQHYTNNTNSNTNNPASGPYFSSPSSYHPTHSLTVSESTAGAGGAMSRAHSNQYYTYNNTNTTAANSNDPSHYADNYAHHRTYDGHHTNDGANANGHYNERGVSSGDYNGYAHPTTNSSAAGGHMQQRQGQQAYPQQEQHQHHPTNHHHHHHHHHDHYNNSGGGTLYDQYGDAVPFDHQSQQGVGLAHGAGEGGDGDAYGHPYYHQTERPQQEQHYPLQGGAQWQQPSAHNGHDGAATAAATDTALSPLRPPLGSSRSPTAGSRGRTTEHSDMMGLFDLRAGNNTATHNNTLMSAGAGGGRGPSAQQHYGAYDSSGAQQQPIPIPPSVTSPWGSQLAARPFAVASPHPTPATANASRGPPTPVAVAGGDVSRSPSPLHHDAIHQHDTDDHHHHGGDPSHRPMSVIATPLLLGTHRATPIAGAGHPPQQQPYYHHGGGEESAVGQGSALTMMPVGPLPSSPSPLEGLSATMGTPVAISGGGRGTATTAADRGSTYSGITGVPNEPSGAVEGSLGLGPAISSSSALVVAAAGADVGDERSGMVRTPTMTGNGAMAEMGQPQHHYQQHYHDDQPVATGGPPLFSPHQQQQQHPFFQHHQHSDQPTMGHQHQTHSALTPQQQQQQQQGYGGDASGPSYSSHHHFPYHYQQQQQLYPDAAAADGGGSRGGGAPAMGHVHYPPPYIAGNAAVPQQQQQQVVVEYQQQVHPQQQQHYDYAHANHNYHDDYAQHPQYQQSHYDSRPQAAAHAVAVDAHPAYYGVTGGEEVSHYGSGGHHPRQAPPPAAAASVASPPPIEEDNYNHGAAAHAPHIVATYVMSPPRIGAAATMVGTTSSSDGGAAAGGQQRTVGIGSPIPPPSAAVRTISKDPLQRVLDGAPPTATPITQSTPPTSSTLSTAAAPRPATSITAADSKKTVPAAAGTPTMAAAAPPAAAVVVGARPPLGTVLSAQQQQQPLTSPTPTAEVFAARVDAVMARMMQPKERERGAGAPNDSANNASSTVVATPTRATYSVGSSNRKKEHGAAGEEAGHQPSSPAAASPPLPPQHLDDPHSATRSYLPTPHAYDLRSALVDAPPPRGGVEGGTQTTPAPSHRATPMASAVGRADAPSRPADVLAHPPQQQQPAVPSAGGGLQVHRLSSRAAVAVASGHHHIDTHTHANVGAAPTQQTVISRQASSLRDVARMRERRGSVASATPAAAATPIPLAADALTHRGGDGSGDGELMGRPVSRRGSTAVIAAATPIRTPTPAPTPRIQTPSSAVLAASGGASHAPVTHQPPSSTSGRAVADAATSVTPMPSSLSPSSMVRAAGSQPKVTADNATTQTDPPQGRHLVSCGVGARTPTPTNEASSLLIASSARDAATSYTPQPSINRMAHTRSSASAVMTPAHAMGSDGGEGGRGKGADLRVIAAPQPIHHPVINTAISNSLINTANSPHGVDHTANVMALQKKLAGLVREQQALKHANESAREGYEAALMATVAKRGGDAGGEGASGAAPSEAIVSASAASHFVGDQEEGDGKEEVVGEEEGEEALFRSQVGQLELLMARKAELLDSLKEENRMLRDRAREVKARLA